jgi:L-malate glycosyltransferase
MKIIYFSQAFTPHDYRFLQKISEAQHNVWFLQIEETNFQSNSKSSLPPGVNLVKWPRGGRNAKDPEAWLQLMPSFEAVLEEIRPDLIHAGPVQSCGFITAMSGFHPFLLMSWGSDILVDTDRDNLWRWVTLFTLRHADMLQCDCQAVREKVETLVPFLAERIVQFPWGVDLNHLTPGVDELGIKHHLGWENNFVILSTRSWEAIYGIDTLLEAFSLASARDSRLRLLLLGGGSLSQEINRFIETHELEPLIFRPGIIEQERVPHYFRAADLYLSCSKSDGSSVSLLEAMATGLPVLVTDIPGNREWVSPGENGWLVEKGNPNATALALLEAADLGPQKRHRIYRANRSVAEERADWHRNFHKLLTAYDRLARL